MFLSTSTITGTTSCVVYCINDAFWSRYPRFWNQTRNSLSLSSTARPFSQNNPIVCTSIPSLRLIRQEISSVCCQTIRNFEEGREGRPAIHAIAVPGIGRGIPPIFRWQQNFWFQTVVNLTDLENQSEPAKTATIMTQKPRTPMGIGIRLK